MENTHVIFISNNDTIDQGRVQDIALQSDDYDAIETKEQNELNQSSDFETSLQQVTDKSRKLHRKVIPENNRVSDISNNDTIDQGTVQEKELKSRKFIQYTCKYIAVISGTLLAVFIGLIGPLLLAYFLGCLKEPCINGICVNEMGNYSCSCNYGFNGTNCEHKIVMTDCSDILHYTGNRNDGIYSVTTWKSHQPINVYCDMTTDGGGWTVFQNRFDGSVEFYRVFSEYDTGFGNLTAEFWLGLSIIQEIAGQGRTDLRIDLKAADNTKAYETFDNFYLSPGPAYTLHVGPTIASLRTSSSYRFDVTHNGCDFTTNDHDADHSAVNCAIEYHGAWWYKHCYSANLNGRYLTPGKHDNSGMTYLSFMYYSSLRSSKMMMRRK